MLVTDVIEGRSCGDNPSILITPIFYTYFLCTGNIFEWISMPLLFCLRCELVL